MAQWCEFFGELPDGSFFFPLMTGQESFLKKRKTKQKFCRLFMLRVFLNLPFPAFTWNPMLGVGFNKEHTHFSAGIHLGLGF